MMLSPFGPTVNLVIAARPIQRSFVRWPHRSSAEQPGATSARREALLVPGHLRCGRLAEVGVDLSARHAGTTRVSLTPVADTEFWTAEQLEKLSPAERSEIIRAGIVDDLTRVPEDFIERVRANVRDHMTTTESAQASER
jgi:hypothetical protein